MFDRINEFFTRQEFACKCGKCHLSNYPSVDAGLLRLLTIVRRHFNQPVIITSGWRCADHNNAVGGAPSSKHLYGIAADIKVKDVDPAVVSAWLEHRYPRALGIGVYPSWVHVDVRPVEARW